MRIPILALSILLPVLCIAQDVVYVNNLDDSGPGSFRNAVATAFDLDTVRVQVSGTVTLTSGSIAYDKTLVIEGPGMDDFIINAGDQVVPFVITGGSTFMSGLTIRDGWEPSGIPGMGGGISFDGDTLYMRDVRVTECNMGGIGGNPRTGGGVRAIAHRARIHDCEFSMNQLLMGTDDNGSAWGGGLYLDCDDILIRSSDFIDNVARGRQNQSVGWSAGGAIYINGDGRIENCLIEGNTARTDTYHGGGPDVDAYAHGGGIFLEYGSDVTLSGCTINGNSLQITPDGDPYHYGAGVYGRGVNMSFENCTISGNIMPTYLPSHLPCLGGGVYASDSELIMRDCILDGNAAYDGSGIHWNDGDMERGALLERTRVLNGQGDESSGAISLMNTLTAHLTDVEVSGNENRGLYARFVAELRVDRCLFFENGGGLFLQELPSGASRIVNTTFHRNGSDLGAALYAENASLIRMNNCTMVDDTIAGGPLPDGREIHLAASSVEMRNTIMSSTVFQAAGVFSASSGGALMSLGGNIARDNSAVSWLTDPTDLNNTNPQLGTFGDHGGFTRTWSLATNSTSIDQGGPDTLSVDQRGFLRDGSADAGAFEYGGIDTQQIFLAGTSPDDVVCEGQLLTVSVEATSTATITYQWQLDGIDIAGATASSYSTIAALGDEGGYTCILTTAGDTVTAGPILITIEVCTGIAEQATRSLRVWPVPAHDAIRLEGLAEGTQLVVRDAMGREVHSQRINGASVQQIVIASWPDGLYTVEVPGGRRAVARVMKVSE